MKKQNFILIYSLLLAIIAARIVDVAARSSGSSGSGTVSNGRCCTTHNLYSLDSSGSMGGSSWSKALTYLNIIWGTTDYASLFTHGGDWTGPPFFLNSYVTHTLTTSSGLPSLANPNGDTDYNDPLIQATYLLNAYTDKKYSDKLCIIFISDGGQEFYGPEGYPPGEYPPTLISNFLNAKKNYEKKTGCPVWIKCYVAVKERESWNEQYYRMCQQKIGVKVQYINFIDQIFSEGSPFNIRSRVSSRSGQPTNGARPSDIKSLPKPTNFD